MVNAAPAEIGPRAGFFRGVYGGGTLGQEAMLILAGELRDVSPFLRGEDIAGHRITDLGEDVFTVGRPHPMIDGSAPLARPGARPPGRRSKSPCHSQLCQPRILPQAERLPGTR